MVTILKGGKRVNIEEEELCQDDTVVLQTGDIVPADLKLIETRGLEIDEFDITGELLPVVKKADNTDVRLYMGSKVLKGTGKGIVVTVGNETEYGKIMGQSWEPEHPEDLPIIRGKYFIFVLLLLPAFVLLYFKLGDITFITSVYLLLSIISIGLQNDDLLRYLLIRQEQSIYQSHHIQICDPGTIERIGEIDTICFDKTGVLTTRDIRVSRICFPERSATPQTLSGKNGTDQLVLLGSALCNDVYFYEKVDQANPVDKALITFAQEQGINVQQLFSQVNHFYEKPFDSENRHMAMGVEINNGESYYFAKGDPTVILEMCSTYQTQAGDVYKMDGEFRKRNISQLESIGQNGDSAIALAYATGSADTIPSKYTFLCMFQLENSLQPEAQEVIQAVKEAGIRSFLLTGDRAETAVKVGKVSGIVGDTNAFLTGRDIDKMGWSEAIRQASYCSIFARLIPSQKGVLIALLQQNGHSIAMIGDGPNDGIALRVADIGISFVKNSSQIARRMSKILINDIVDLRVLIEGAKRYRSRIKWGKLLSILILTAIIFGFYTWSLVLLPK